MLLSQVDIIASKYAPLPTSNVLDFLTAYGVPEDIINHAQQVANRIGVAPDEALLGEDVIPEEIFYRALADWLCLRFHVGQAELAPLTEPELALKSGIVYLSPHGAPYRAIVAPRGLALKALMDSVNSRPICGLAVTSPRRLAALIRRQQGSQIAERASYVLERKDPTLTARLGAQPSQMGLIVGAGLVLAAVAPPLQRAVTSILLWGVFSLAILLRSAVAMAATDVQEPPPLDDADLPIYTILVPMYREGNVLHKLIKGLTNLDYPKAKLDIKLLIEACDEETLAAVSALDLPAAFDVVVVPPGSPRTKPRALNVALETVRGELVCIFDAEDEPEPDQLRRAAAHFAYDKSLSALQGKLTIGNAHDSWFSFMFAVEYAALFELINPGLSALGLPVALGGTTNHFRKDILRRVGGWDAWNVTEDADLGLRLARYGARIGALDSRTVEEAPITFRNWFYQRRRWQKGFMQTLIVHTRQPRRYFQELGLLRGLAGLVLVGGTVMTGLFGPLLFGAALWRGVQEAAGETNASRLADVYTYILTFSGAQVIALPAVVAMYKRGMRDFGRAILGMPLYYTLVSLATWFALYDLLLRPFHWHKTAHGCTHVKSNILKNIVAPDFVSRFRKIGYSALRLGQNSSRLRTTVLLENDHNISTS